MKPCETRSACDGYWIFITPLPLRKHNDFRVKCFMQNGEIPTEDMDNEF